MQLFDYCSYTSYSFDFENWFKNFNMEYDEIKLWKQILLKAYKNISNFNYTDECFQYPLSLGQEIVFLHFNILNIKNSSHKTGKLKLVRLSDITLDYQNSPFIFSLTTDYEDVHIFSDKPIILCPVPSCYGIKYVVIDGNHRVTAKKAAQLYTINALFYTPNLLSDFVNEFEYQLYSFLKYIYIKSC